MGFFKSIGNKLKRVISIKNLVRGVTGQFGAIGADAIRVATTTDPKKGKSVPDATLIPVNYAIPAPAMDVLNAQGSIFAKKVVDSVAGVPVVQNTNAFMSKIYIQSMWIKYKNWIIGFLIVLVTTLTIWKLTKSKTRGRRR